VCACPRVFDSQLKTLRPTGCGMLHNAHAFDDTRLLFFTPAHPFCVSLVRWRVLNGRVVMIVLLFSMNGRQVQVAR
jgi:hypothetical protein